MSAGMEMGGAIRSGTREPAADRDRDRAGRALRSRRSRDIKAQSTERMSFGAEWEGGRGGRRNEAVDGR
jgi:hypothetical protein